MEVEINGVSCRYLFGPFTGSGIKEAPLVAVECSQSRCFDRFHFYRDVE